MFNFKPLVDQDKKATKQTGIAPLPQVVRISDENVRSSSSSSSSSAEDQAKKAAAKEQAKKNVARRAAELAIKQAIMLLKDKKADNSKRDEAKTKLPQLVKDFVTAGGDKSTLPDAAFESYQTESNVLNLDVSVTPK